MSRRRDPRAFPNALPCSALAMNQPPPLHGELPSRPPGESSGLTKLLGVLMVGPLFVLAIGTLWVPAFSIVLTSFQNRTGGGSTAGANWTNALGFTVAIAVVRLLASIFPIIFAVSLAFTGAVTRTVTFAIGTSVFVVRDLLWQLVSSRHNDNLAQILLTSVEEQYANGIGPLLSIFAAGSLAFFPALAILQILVVDRIRIRAD